jgi:hypothetical protein
MTITHALRALLLITLLATTADAQTWDVAFAKRGPNGPINAIAFHGGDIYIGGEFTEVDGVPASNVAVFDGTRWKPLGGGVDARVSAIAVADAGVFVGGSFDSAAGQPMRGLALYTGGEWRSLETQETKLDRDVNAIAIAGDDVFVGGQFSMMIDGVRQQSIAVWSMRDRAWRGLGGGVRVRDASWGDVLAIATNDRYAYVAGLFTYVNIGSGEIRSSGLARWDRQSNRWDSLGGVEPVEDGALEVARALAIDGPHVYALGDFRAVDGVEVDGVARFDETRGEWEDVGLVGLSFNTAVAARNATVYAANGSDLEFPDDALVMREGDGQWGPSGAGIEGSIYVITFAPNGDLYVGGEFDTARGTTVRNIIRRAATTRAPSEPELASSAAAIRSLRNGILTLDLPQATAPDTRITVHDLLGRELATLTPGSLARGLQVIGIDAALPAICVVTLRTGDLTVARILRVEN